MSVLTYIDSYTYDGEEYFSYLEYNGLFSRNLVSGKVSFLGISENEEKELAWIHRKVLGLDSHVYFFPFAGRGITRYDIGNHSFDYLSLKDRNITGIDNAFLVNGKLLLIPFNIFMDDILELDLNTYCISNRIAVPKQKDLQGEKAGIDLFGTARYGEAIYIGICGSDAVYKLDVRDYSVELHRIKGFNRIRNLSIADGALWITGTGDVEVYKVDISTFACEKVEIQNGAADEGMLLKVTEWNGKIVILPGSNHRMYEYKPEENCFVDMGIDIPYEWIGDVVGYKISDVLTLYSQDYIGEGCRMREGGVKIDLKGNVDREVLNYKYESILLRNRFLDSDFLMEKDDGVQSLDKFLEMITLD